MYTGSKTEGGVFRNGTFSEFNVKQNLRDEKKKKDNISGCSVLNLSWSLKVPTAPGITDGDFGEIPFFGKTKRSDSSLSEMQLALNCN